MKNMWEIYNLPHEELWFFVKCYKDFIENYFEEHEYGNNIPISMVEFYNNEYEEFYQDYLDYLWEDLAYVGCDDKDCITEDFYIWKKGTFREDIWHWFDIRVKDGIGNRYF